MEQVGEEAGVGSGTLTRSLVKPTPFFVALAGLAELDGCELCRRRVWENRGYVEPSTQLYGVPFLALSLGGPFMLLVDETKWKYSSKKRGDW